MYDFETFINAVDDYRKGAATFYKVDLHVHSYESHDFPKLGDKTGCAKKLLSEDREKKSNHHIDFAKKVKDLRIIAITDHNMSRVAGKIAKLSDDELLVLPGIEVTIQTTFFPDSTVHILAIFPENYTSEDIEKIFPIESGLPSYDDRKEGSTVTIPIEQLIKNIHDMKGLCIAGHVNSDEGVRTLFRDNNVGQLEIRRKIAKLEGIAEERELKPKEASKLKRHEKRKKELEDDMQNRYLQFLTEYEFDAIEVQKSSDFQQYYSGDHTDALGIRPIPCVIGSDAHNLQDIGLAGYTTYIKMQSPSFRGLKLALRDPSTRIRYEDTVSHELVPRLLGVRFSGGFFKKQVIGFSDNLTCLIGGRGSGKSATVESLRYIFEHEITNLTGEKRKDITDRRSFTLKDASVEVLYSDRNGDKFVLRRDFGADKTECFGIDGHKRDDVDVAVASNLDVKIYGWGEIEELARNKRDQLALIDGFIEDIELMKDTVHEKMRDIERNTQSIVELARDIEQLLPKIEELPQKRETLALINDEDIDEVFEGSDRNLSAKTGLSRFERNINKLRQPFPIDESNEPISLKQKIVGAIGDVKQSLISYDWGEAFQSDVLNQADSIQNAYKALIIEFDKLSALTGARIKLIEEERAEIDQSLRSKMTESGIADDHANLIRQRQQLSTKVAELSGYEADIKSKSSELEVLLQTRHEQLLPSLDEAKQAVTRRREEKIIEINKELHRLNSAVKVTLELHPQQDTKKFQSYLGVDEKKVPNEKVPDGVLKGLGQKFKANDYAGHYSRLHTPQSFVQAVLANDYSALTIAIEKNSRTHQIVDDDKAKGVVNEVLSKVVDWRMKKGGVSS